MKGGLHGLNEVNTHEPARMDHTSSAFVPRWEERCLCHFKCTFGIRLYDENRSINFHRVNESNTFGNISSQEERKKLSISFIKMKSEIHHPP